MMWKVKWSRFIECFCRRPGLILILLPCLIIVTLYLVSSNEYEYDVLLYPSFKAYNIAEGESLFSLFIGAYFNNIFVILVQDNSAIILLDITKRVKHT